MTTTILPNWETVGKEFVELYYRTFATNREGVMNLYHVRKLMVNRKLTDTALAA